MGLFGYNKNDFAKSTERFKEQLSNLVVQSMDTYQLGSTLDSIIRLLDRQKCPDKLNGKEIKALDEHIERLINSIRDDLSQHRGAVASAHTGLLLEAISDCRPQGRITFSETELKQKESQAVLFGKIELMIRRKAAIIEEQKRIQLQSTRLSPDSPQYNLNRLQYNKLESEKKELTNNLCEYQKTYETYVKAVLKGASAQESEELVDLNNIDPVEFGHTVERLNKNYEKNASKLDMVNSIIDESDQASAARNADVGESDFDAGVKELQNQELAGSINRAAPPVESDPFEEAMRKSNRS